VYTIDEKYKNENILHSLSTKGSVSQNGVREFNEKLLSKNVN